MRKIFLFLGLASLLFSLGCGSSSSGPTPQGNYSNASLNGSYVYQMSGFDLNTGVPYTRMGVVSLNGAGTITSGTDTFNEGSSPSTLPISGSYSISNDGTGTLTVSFSSTGAALQWAVTIQSTNKFYLIETSTNPVSGGATSFTGYGVAEIQTSTTQPSATFAFRSHIVSTTTIVSTSMVGQIVATGGAITGTADLNILGTGLIASSPVTGSFVAPDATGFGSGSITVNSVANTFSYYVVDTSHIVLLFTSLGSEGIGRAEVQSGTFTNASLAGNYAFGSRGDTSNNLLGAHTVGVFSADGAGNISSFNFDAMRDGTLTSNGSFTGNTYAVTSNGRVTVSLNGGSATQVYWLVNNARAFFLASDATSAIDGTADLQVGSGFSNSSLNGQFAFVNDGVQLISGGNNTIDRVATLQFNGSGSSTFNEFINVSGTPNTPGFLSGSYSASSNGRTTGKINGSGNNVNLVFYLVSGSQAYMLQTDANFEVSGMMQLQQ